jgi:hypothetical protein
VYVPRDQNYRKYELPRSALSGPVLGFGSKRPVLISREAYHLPAVGRSRVVSRLLRVRDITCVGVARLNLQPLAPKARVDRVRWWVLEGLPAPMRWRSLREMTAVRGRCYMGDLDRKPRRA